MEPKGKEEGGENISRGGGDKEEDENKETQYKNAVFFLAQDNS